MPTAANIPSLSSESGPKLDVRNQVPYDEFVSRYLLPRKPVIFTDAISDWKAVSAWTPEYLKKKIGGRKVPFRGLPKHQESFHALTEQMLQSTPENPGVYMQNVDIQRDLPEIYSDVAPRIRYASPDWKSSRLMPKDWLFTNEIEASFYAGRGTCFPHLHYDYYGLDAFISQIYGEKEFVVFSPNDSPYLYSREDDPLKSSIDDVENRNDDRFPLFRCATPVRFTLHPGETLYVPNGWWHTARMRSVSIGVITVFWNAANWNKFTREVLRDAWRGRMYRRLCMVPYMGVVGLLLRARDRLA